MIEQYITDILIGGFVIVLLLSVFLRETDWQRMHGEIVAARIELEDLLNECVKTCDSGL